MKVLVTGGSGYVGSAIVETMVAAGHEVAVLDPDFVPEKHDERVVYERLNCSDLVDPWRSKRRHRLGKFDVVVHAAAHSIVSESIQLPYAYYDHNVMESLKLIGWVGNSARLIFLSSAAVYGSDYPGDELNYSPTPTNPYGDTKLTIERAIRWIHPNYVILRLFNVCGATPMSVERHNPETHLIPTLLHAAHTGKRVTMYGDPTKFWRTYVHVGDVADAVLRAVDWPVGTYNLGNEEWSNAHIIKRVEEVMGKKLDLEIGKERGCDPKSIGYKQMRAWDMGWRTRGPNEGIVDAARAYGYIP